MTESMCCLWQVDDNSPKRRLPADGLFTNCALECTIVSALGICFVDIRMAHPGPSLHLLPYLMDYESV